MMGMNHGLTLSIDSIADFRSSSLYVKIHRVPTMVKDSSEEKYYVPKVVSIGPYHHGNPKLDFVEKLKPAFTMKLLHSKENLISLCTNFAEPDKVRDLRNFYEESATVGFSDTKFVKMMVLDACFILYYILHIFGEKLEDYCEDLNSHLIVFGKKREDCRKLMKSRQIVFVHQDLFLLENQIPFQVLHEVMKLLNSINRIVMKIELFVVDHILAREGRSKRWHKSSENSASILGFDLARPDHLLHLYLSKHEAIINRRYKLYTDRFTFRNVSELTDVGIRFKPSSSMVNFFRTSWWWSFSACVELPQITVDDLTKMMFLNLIAYEMCFDDERFSFVTSYVCLLNSLIDHPDDVKTLRKAGVLDSSLGINDQDVVKLFKDIGTYLVPNELAYMGVMSEIQRHYESWRYGIFSKIKRQYVRQTAFVALYGALISLFLSGVQAYFTVWSPKGQCS